MYNKKNSFEDVLNKISDFWKKRGCLYSTSIDTEVGAATLNPSTFFRVLNNNNHNVYYVQQCKRHSDSRFGFGKNRVFNHHQFQVILKPCIDNFLDIYLESLSFIGINVEKVDIKFYQDNWEHPALGAFGFGWEVLINGMEVTQITYFKQCGCLPLSIISCEIAYGLERLLVFIQESNNVNDILWSFSINNNNLNKYEKFFFLNEFFFSFYNFSYAIIKHYFYFFLFFLKESLLLLKLEIYFISFLNLLKSSNSFNFLESKFFFNNNERIFFIFFIKNISKNCAFFFLKNYKVL